MSCEFISHSSDSHAYPTSLYSSRFMRNTFTLWLRNFDGIFISFPLYIIVNTYYIEEPWALQETSSISLFFSTALIVYIIIPQKLLHALFGFTSWSYKRGAALDTHIILRVNPYRSILKPAKIQINFTAVGTKDITNFFNAFTIFRAVLYRKIDFSHRIQLLFIHARTQAPRDLVHKTDSSMLGDCGWRIVWTLKHDTIVCTEQRFFYWGCDINPCTFTTDWSHRSCGTFKVPCATSSGICCELMYGGKPVIFKPTYNRRVE